MPTIKNTNITVIPGKSSAKYSLDAADDLGALHRLADHGHRRAAAHLAQRGHDDPQALGLGGALHLGAGALEDAGLEQYRVHAVLHLAPDAQVRPPPGS